MKYLETIHKIIQEAMQKEPSAWLYEIQAIMCEENEQVCPDQVYYIKMIFGLTNNRTLIYDAEKDGSVRSEITNSPWLEDRPLPHRFSIDIGEAYDALLRANLPFDTLSPVVVLRHPLYPGVNEPAFIFTVSDRDMPKFISVSLYSGQVRFVE